MRACVDCGIADWQPCQCDPRADLGHPDPRNFTLRSSSPAGRCPVCGSLLIEDSGWYRCPNECKVVVK